MTHDPRTESIWTIPNAVSALRLLGLAPLLWAAHGGHRNLLLVILAVLLVSDWVDGKLAARLDQRTEFGARLDSAVDAAMYTAIALSLWWLEGATVRRELPWFVAAIGSWGISVVVSLARFRRMPSYHTLGAKASWLVVGATVLIWIGIGDARAVPWALGLVTLTNLEAIAIGFALPGWRADVPTLVSALRLRREPASEPGSGGATEPDNGFG